MKLKAMFIVMVLPLFALAQYGGKPQTCEAIAQSSSATAASCIQAVVGRYVDPNADAVCAKVAQSSSYNALTCIQGAVGRYSAAGLRVCSTIANSSSATAAQCVSQIANKILDERFVDACVQTALSSSYNGLTCVKNLIIGDYGSTPQPGQPDQPGQCDRRLAKLVRRASQAVRDGQTRRALQILENLEQRLSGEQY